MVKAWDFGSQMCRFESYYPWFIGDVEVRCRGGKT